MQLATALRTTASRELESRYWGSALGGSTKYGLPRFLLTDLRGIALLTGLIRYYLIQTDSVMFYRGQTEDWQLIPSVFRGTTTNPERKEAFDWLAGVMKDLPRYFDVNDPFNDPFLREALAQHYGLPTTWIDVVDHIQTAAWFAYDSSKAIPGRDLVTGNRDDAVGYIYLLASQVAPDGSRFKWRDLRVKPSNWLRPHVQQAFVLRRSNPLAYSGSLEEVHVTTIVVPRPLLQGWSNYDVMPPSLMYPGDGMDRGLQYWNRAAHQLETRHNHRLLPPKLRGEPKVNTVESSKDS
jgi:hypothetical protein